MKKTILNILVVLSINVMFAQTHSRGLIFNPTEYQKAPLKANILIKGDLPDKISLKKYTPEINSQGPYGTCVGWSTGWAFRTTLEAVKNNWTDKNVITKNAFSPLFVYYNALDNKEEGCKKGTSIFNAFKTLKNIGVPYYYDFSPMCANEIQESIYEKAKYHKIENYSRLFDYNSDGETKVNKIKEALFNKQPVSIGILCPNSFDIAKNVWNPTEDPQSIESGHAITVIGYDDNMYGGAFEIMNSWGKDWGNNGFMWIKYSDMGKYCHSGFTATLKSNEYFNIIKGTVKIVGENGKRYSVKKISGINSKGQNTVENTQIADYTVVEDLHSGDKYRLLISTEKPVYMYVLASDLNNNNSVLFPNNSKVNPFIDTKLADVPIPNNNYWIQLDNNTGVDFVIVIYSVEKLDVNRIKNEINNTSGTINDKIEKALSNYVMKKEHVKFDSNNISFSASSKNKKAVAIVIKMNHKN